jgi:hypothetical protein
MVKEARGPAFRIAALSLVVISLSGIGFLMLPLMKPPGPDGGGGAGDEKPGANLFRLWPQDRQPDVVLIVSGQTFGYLQPCGCSHPQYGGLERRYNFMKSLITERGWPLAALDLGDIAQRSGPQTLVKYAYSMRALNRLNYAAVGIGYNETALPLIEALSEYSLNNPSPRVLAANLLNRVQNFPAQPGESMVGTWLTITSDMISAKAGQPKGSLPRIGVVGVVAESVAKQVQDPTVRFAGVNKELTNVLTQLQPTQPELLVLLFQGSPVEAGKCAADFPQFRVIVCLSPEDEPPAAPDHVGNTMIVRLGHKGRYVGAVGVYRPTKADAARELHYELVRLGPEYETPAGKDADNPILKILDDYARDVKGGNYLANYPKSEHPIQRQFPTATYVGSEKCKECHKTAYKTWKESPHARAYASLEQAQRPSHRQYDGECVVCHVTGFEYRGGYANETATAHLKNNGCENCHGPASLHIQQMRAGQKNDQMLALMNPYKTKPGETPEERERRINRLDQSCQKCHDTDNDVHWSIDKWVKGKIIHMGKD